MKMKLNKVIKTKIGLFSSIMFLIVGLCVNTKVVGQNFVLSQCAINLVKGLDSLISNKGGMNLNCIGDPGSNWIPFIVKQHRTILQGNCSMAPIPCTAGDVYVYTWVDSRYTNPLRMFWPTSISVPSWFGTYNLCTPAPGYFTKFPTGGTSGCVDNHVDEIHIKKISGSTVVNENVHLIKSITNPRIMTPMDQFWTFVLPADYTNLNNASGILIDVVLNDDTQYTGMLWHKFSPENPGIGANYMQWKTPVTCPTLNSFNQTTLTSTTCSKIQFTANYVNAVAGTSLAINYGDGSTWNITPNVVDPSTNNIYTYSSPGSYVATGMLYGPGGCLSTLTTAVTVTCTIPCIDCVPSFAPEPSATKKYVLNAWVKENNPVQSKTTYTNPKISITFTPAATAVPFTPTGDIIDGWQRIEGEFLIPVATTQIGIMLECLSGDCFFDDVRVFPTDGSMKSYVYDPVNMRLVAELDERNYATLYEYDEEGKLIRVKKETEKGKMTIQENRSNTSK